jgi:hypothetical protein
VKNKETTPEARKVFHDEAMKVFRERLGLPGNIDFSLTGSRDSGGGEFNNGFFVYGIASADLTRYDRVVISADRAYWAGEKTGAFVLLFINKRREYTLEFCYVPSDDVTPFTTEGLRFDFADCKVTPPDAFKQG